MLCITSMHRSGSSLVTAWLETCGLRVYDRKVLAATSSNPKGHFEDREFYDLQSSAIYCESPRSDGWKIYPRDFLRFKADQLLRAHELVDTRNKKYLKWGWKDPRSVVYLGQWKDIIPNLKVLLIWRPCCEVASSLVRRGKMERTVKITTSEAIRLWVNQSQLICEYKRRYPKDTLLLSLEAIIRDDLQVFELINDRLQLGLEYSPLSKIYDQNILHTGKASLMMQFLGISYRPGEIEKTLRLLSDM